MFFNLFYLALKLYERGVLYILIFFVISSDFAFKWIKVNFPNLGPELNAFEIDV